MMHQVAQARIWILPVMDVTHLARNLHPIWPVSVVGALDLHTFAEVRQFAALLENKQTVIAIRRKKAVAIWQFVNANNHH